MAGAPRNSSTTILLLQAQVLLFAAGAIVATAGANSTAGSSSCGCSPDVCCSLLGYCGNTTDYCGDGCQSGPCLPSPPPAATNGAIRVADVVTEAFFDGIIGQAVSGCEGKGFYTRKAFLDAATIFPTFGRVGAADDSKREIAAFFAHATYLTGYFCRISDKDGPVCCEDQNLRYRCAPGKKYFARGPMQMAWNYNYGAASTAIGTDILRSPETVRTNATVSFQASLWFWMVNVHPDMASGGGFGPSITAVHGGFACDGSSAWLVDMLVGYYKDYCAELGVDPGDNITCAQSLQTDQKLFGDGYLNLNVSISIKTF